MQYDPVTYGCQFTIGGITINGSTDSTGCDWVLTSETGWFASPAIKTARVDKPAARGTFRGNEFRGARVIVLQCTVSAPTVAALRAAEYRALGICPNPRLQYPLTVVDETGLSLYANVVLDGEILITPIAWNSATVSIQLVAPDPRKFASNPTVVSVLLASAGTGGVAYPVAYPVSYGTPGLPGAVVLTNNGSADADPTVTLTGPLTNPSLIRADTGDTVTYLGTLLATDTLVINFGAGSAMLDGVNRRSLLAASWFTIPAYSSITMLFRTTNIADTGSMSVSYGNTSY